jgi:hypothetical protein
MAKERTYRIRLTQTQLEIVQRLLEEAATSASGEQVAELEKIDGKIYEVLFPSMARPTAKPSNERIHSDWPACVSFVDSLRARARCGLSA